MNRIVFLFSSSTFLLLVYREFIDFCVNFVSRNVTKIFISSKVFWKNTYGVLCIE